MSDRIIFWFNNHPLSPLADRLTEKFMGESAHVEVEVLRAVLRLNHDYYNNGFGNNMSRPIAYIERFYLPVATSEFAPAFARISEAAMEPWTASRGVLDDDFNLVITEVLTHLKTADDAGTLSPLTTKVMDMPYREIEYPQNADYYCDLDDE